MTRSGQRQTTRRIFLAALALAVLALPARAQRGEFLSAGEISQIREAQEPDQRLKLYAQFAGQRLEAVEKELAGSETRRAEQIHGLLREYDRIIDAIDSNAENAVTKRNPVRKGLELVLEREPEFLKLLRSFRARNPKDLEEYKLILERAIETTESSMALLSQILEKQPKGRKEEKEERKKKQEKKRSSD